MFDLKLVKREPHRNPPTGDPGALGRATVPPWNEAKVLAEVASLVDGRLLDRNADRVLSWNIAATAAT